MDGQTLATRLHGSGLGTKLPDAWEIGAEERVQNLALAIGQWKRAYQPLVLQAAVNAVFV